MHWKILAAAALYALSIPATFAFAKPSEQPQTGTKEDKGEDDQQQVGSHYPYDPHARGPYYGALVPPPPETLHQNYPVCTKEITDGCINPNQLRRQRQTNSEKDESSE